MKTIHYQEIKRISCVDEKGSRHTVIERQKMINDSSYGTAKGNLDYITASGLDVNLLSDGRYQIVQTDDILTPVA